MPSDRPKAAPEDRPQPQGRFDPDFCEFRCPICTRARQGNGLARFLQSIELLVTWGGCPWGRARQRKYGVKPNEVRREG